MFKLIGLSGSLRRSSFNTGLLNAAVGLMPSDSELVVRTIEGIPVYDADFEAEQGIPPSVEELKNLIANADGLVIATPEYNNSIPGPLKNTIDWLTRPPADIPRVFRGKPVAIIGATPGGLGTALSQIAWLPVLRFLETRLWNSGRLTVSKAGTLFDAQGQLTDAKTIEQLQQFFRGFVDFVRSSKQQ